jgi:hypothetical protein
MRYLLLLSTALLLSACSATFQAPAVCSDGPSAILDITKGNPTGLDRALLTVNIAALEKHVYTADQAQQFIDQVKGVVNGNISYIGLLDYLNVSTARINKALGLSVILMGDQVPEVAKLGGSKLISACDRELIFKHLAKQEMILSLYK